MSDPWAMPMSRDSRVARTQGMRELGTVDGRMGGTAPPPPRRLDPMEMTPAQIMAAVTQVFSEFNTSTGYNTLVQEFLSSFATYITTPGNQSIVNQLIQAFLQEITYYLDVFDNSTTSNFTREVIEEITLYLNTHDNSVTSNFAGAVIEEITQYLNTHKGKTLVNRFFEALGTASGFGVYVQPDEPETTVIGALWFDTDAF